MGHFCAYVFVCEYGCGCKGKVVHQSVYWRGGIFVRVGLCVSAKERDKWPFGGIYPLVFTLDFLLNKFSVF